MSKTVTAVFQPGQQSAYTTPLFQYDYGRVLQFEGLALPASYEVHFSNGERGVARVMIGSSAGVPIPNECLAVGKPICVHVFLHDSAADGRTQYSVTIPVTRRACPVMMDSSAPLPSPTPTEPDTEWSDMGGTEPVATEEAETDYYWEDL